MQNEQPLSMQEAMQRQAHLLLQVGDLSMQLEQRQSELDAMRNRLLVTRLELAQLTGYTQAMEATSQPAGDEPPKTKRTGRA